MMWVYTPLIRVKLINFDAAASILNERYLLTLFHKFLGVSQTFCVFFNEIYYLVKRKNCYFLNRDA
jgi:hypothetical protein